ncbi:MAG: FAD-binding protein [Thermoplasmata archaeon]|nr:MAG: FAD-binding protein [Thermoplasmata archaeon]
MSVHEGVPDAVLFPTSTDQVVEILKLANQEKIPVVPRGSGTSVTGAIVANEGGIVLDMTKMNKIKEINVEDRYAVVEPGVVCGELNKELAPANFFPPDPGSSAVCTIGGMVSTNASGLRAVKYGTTKDHVLALEMVLPDGKIYRTGTLAPKTSSGFDLTRLFVNSEGTLGVITEITVKISPVPDYIAFATACFPKIEQAGSAISKMLSTGIPLACCEIMDNICIKVINDTMKLDLPDVEGMLIIEVDGAKSAVQEDMEKIISICEEFKGLNINWSDKPEERLAMWKGRGGLVASLSRYTPGKRLIPIAEDFGVPITKIPEGIKRVQKIAKEQDIIIATFGHVGDGNLHSTFIIDVRDEAEWKKVETIGDDLINLALELGGTITAEHGSGLAKAPFIRREVGESLDIMRKIKNALDPNNIMNPGTMALDDKPHKMYDYFAFENFLTSAGVKTSFSEMVDNEILACIQCGFCRAGCPTFNETTMESLNARGRIILAYNLLSGKNEPSAELAEPIYGCTTCMNCTMVCPPGIKVVKIMEAVRKHFNKLGIIRPEHEKIYANIKESHNPFGESPEVRNKLADLANNPESRGGGGA